MSCKHVRAHEHVSMPHSWVSQSLCGWLPRAGPHPAMSLSQGLWGLSVTSAQPGREPWGLVGMVQLSLRWQRCPFCPIGVAGGLAGTELRAEFPHRPRGGLSERGNQAGVRCWSSRALQRELGEVPRQWSCGWTPWLNAKAQKAPSHSSPKALGCDGTVRVCPVACACFHVATGPWLSGTLLKDSTLTGCC